MKKTLLSIAALLLAAMMMLGGCAQTAPAPQSEAASEPAPEPVADPELDVCIGGEPRTLDPAGYSTPEEAGYIVQLFEGLTTVAADGRVTAAAAKLWTVGETEFGQPVYTFTLREDAQWSDGTALKAEDFLYAWRRAADPATESPYGYLLSVLKGGAAIQNGEAEPDTLGVEVDEDGRLVVTLEGPCQYFTQLLTLPVFFPLREDIVTENPAGWANTPGYCVSNGAYLLTEWEHDSAITMERNDRYYNASSVAVQRLTCHIYEYQDEAYAAMNSGEIDYLATDAAPARSAEEQAAAEEAGAESSGSSASAAPAESEPVAQIAGGANRRAESYYFVTNRVSGPAQNYKFARALSLALDRSALIEALNVSYMPAAGLIPYGMTTTYTKKEFRELAGDPLWALREEGEDSLAAAKRYLREAGFGDGSTAPELRLITNDTPAQVSIAYAAAEIWKQTLGVTVKVEALDYEEFIERRAAGDFDIARGGAVPVCGDPELILNSFCSEYSGKWYNNADYDALMKSARLEDNSSVRSLSLIEAEEKLISQGAVIPVMFRVGYTQSQPQVEGVVFTGTGIYYLMYARNYLPAETE